MERRKQRRKLNNNNKKRTFDKVLDLGSKRAETGERLRFHGEKCVSHGGEQFK